MSSSDTGVTQLLVQWSAGDERALESLLPIIYDNLHRLARSYLRRERPDHTLQATALVNEAYLRLVDQKKICWQNRAQFFGVAAQLMRRILVDHARAQRADKRGGDGIKLSLTAADRIARWRNVDLIALDDALKTLAEIDPQQGRIVELKFFGGLTIEETSEVLGISHATVERDWSMARAWLKREIKKSDSK